MTRKRDLSGFAGAGPTGPPKRRPEPQPVPAGTPDVGGPPDQAPAKPARRRKETKKRITLSLPAEVANALRAESERRNLVYLAIVTEAFRSHAASIATDVADARRRGEPSPSASRRRRVGGRTQIPLNIAVDDLAEIDGQVRAAGLDRSAYVTELLVRYLA